MEELDKEDPEFLEQNERNLQRIFGSSEGFRKAMGIKEEISEKE